MERFENVKKETLLQNDRKTARSATKHGLSFDIPLRIRWTVTVRDLQQAPAWMLETTVVLVNPVHCTDRPAKYEFF